VRFLLLVI